MDGWLIARVRGIPVRAHLSLLLALPYVLMVGAVEWRALASLSGLRPAELQGSGWVWGVVLAAALAGAVFVHELFRIFLLRQQGIRVVSATLYLLAGHSATSSTRGRGQGRDRAEIWASLGAWLLMLAVAFVFYQASRAVSGLEMGFGLFLTGQVFLALFAVNLLPAFPFDLARVIAGASAVWSGHERAWNLVCVLGMGAAMVVGVLGVFTLDVLFVLLAVALFSASSAERRILRARQAVAGLTAADIMHPVEHRLLATMPISQARQALEREPSAKALPVVGAAEQGSRLVGWASAQVLNAVPREGYSSIPLGLAAEVDIPLVARGDSAADALELVEAQGPVVAVVDAQGALEGLIEREDFERRVPRQAA